MSLVPGTRLGVYEILSSLGAGGMGEVYRARDTRLNRDVAVKVLPEIFAGDPERLARFEREAQVLASLNHTNIAGIHGLEDSGGVRALVLELVEGPTLADRIAQGPMPVGEALATAKQIAWALESAHEQGIVHRDLKPANVKLRPDGTVKVLDFGLAKLTDPSGSIAPNDAGPRSMLPTITSPALMTGAGVMLGTAAYMSPEQARGKPVDTRADVWAFGCVLYEMLTGARAFPGEDVTQTIASVIRGEPDWRALPADLPAGVRMFLQRSLEKDLRGRVQHIGDLRLALDGAFDVATAGQPSTAGRGWTRALVLAAAVLLAAGLGFTGARVVAPEPPAAAPPIRFALDVPQIFEGAAHIALSRDGRTIAFSAMSAAAVRTLWLRDLRSAEIRELPQARLAGSIAWSPDGRFLAFTTERSLQTADVVSGAIRTVHASLPQSLAAGLAWVGTDILVAANEPDGASLLVLPATGGEPRRLASPGAGRFAYLSDSDVGGFLYLWEGDRGRQACVAETDGRVRGCVPLEASTVSYVSGQLLFAAGTTLFVQPFDLERAATTGVATPLVDNVLAGGAGRHWWTASGGVPGAALLAYLPVTEQTSRLTWFDRGGRPVANTGEAGAFRSFDLSDDGRFLIATRMDGSSSSAYLLDVLRGTATRAVGAEKQPRDIVWAPDGRRIVYHTGPGRLVEQPAFGGPERVIYENADILGLEDWSADGRLLAVLQRDGNDRAIVLVPVDGGAPTVVISAPAVYDEFRFSPDGRWLAYNSDESGRQEVYLAPLPPTGERWPVSIGGGVQPRWNPNGRELFYLALDGTLMAVTVGGGTPPATGRPAPLFKAELLPTFNVDHFEVAPGGDRFLFRIPATGDRGSTIDVIVNWPGLLRAPAVSQ